MVLGQEKKMNEIETKRRELCFKCHRVKGEGHSFIMHTSFDEGVRLGIKQGEKNKEKEFLEMIKSKIKEFALKDYKTMENTSYYSSVMSRNILSVNSFKCFERNSDFKERVTGEKTTIYNYYFTEKEMESCKK
jgi:hypothetical protein